MPKVDGASPVWTPWLAPALACLLFVLAAPQGRFDSWVAGKGISDSGSQRLSREGEWAWESQSGVGSTVEQNAPPNPRIERLLAMDVGRVGSRGSLQLLQTNQSLH